MNEEWLTSYRGWVYGAGFGAQLGTGVVTIVTSPIVYGVVLLAVVVPASRFGRHRRRLRVRPGRDDLVRRRCADTVRACTAAPADARPRPGCRSGRPLRPRAGRRHPGRRRRVGMTRPLDGHGLHVAVPAGWDGRIRVAPDAGAGGDAGRQEAPGAVYPVLHVASVPIPDGRGDFGSGVVEILGPGDVFVALLEYGPESLGTALFAKPRPASIVARDLRPNALQRVIAGQLGAQWFFEASGRAFCLYVVLGGRARLAAAIADVNAVLTSLTID